MAYIAFSTSTALENLPQLLLSTPSAHSSAFVTSKCPLVITFFNATVAAINNIQHAMFVSLISTSQKNTVHGEKTGHACLCHPYFAARC
jgi:hypothetical protein